VPESNAHASGRVLHSASKLARYGETGFGKPATVTPPDLKTSKLKDPKALQDHRGSRFLASDNPSIVTWQSRF